MVIIVKIDSDQVDEDKITRAIEKAIEDVDHSLSQSVSLMRIA